MVLAGFKNGDDFADVDLNTSKHVDGRERHTTQSEQGEKSGRLKTIYVDNMRRVKAIGCKTSHSVPPTDIEPPRQIP